MKNNFLPSAFLFFYRLLLAPLGVLIAFILWPLSNKIKVGFKLRANSKLPKTFLSQPIWFHASSGEFEYAKPVITEIKKRHPSTPIVVSFFSPSYEKQIKKFPGVDFALPLPLDLKNPVRNCIEKINPKLFLVARTDLWPELLVQLRKRQVPSLLFSTTFNSSNWAQALFAPYYQLVLSQFTQIFAVSVSDEENIKKCAPGQSVKTIGDTRYDQVVSRLNGSSTIKDSVFASSTPIFIAGSTWPADEAQLIPALTDLIKTSKIKLVLVPHEVNPPHLEQLKKLIHSYGLRPTFYSQCASPDWSVLIVDQVGILAELYKLGAFAFIGGSFKRKVHSVMEALATGAITFVGPFYKNNREAIEFLSIPNQSPIKAVQVVGSSRELSEKLSQLLVDPNVSAARQQIAEEVRRRTGGAAQVVNWIESHLN